MLEGWWRNAAGILHSSPFHPAPFLFFLLFRGLKRVSEGQACAAAAGRRDAILMCARPSGEMSHNLTLCVPARHIQWIKVIISD